MPPLFCHRSSLYHSLLQSPKLTPALSSPQHLWFCCEGIFSVCGGHSSISWIYSGKSKAFFTSLSLLSNNVCLSKRVCVCVCARMHYLFQDFTSRWRLKVVMPLNLWWLATSKYRQLPFYPCATAVLKSKIPYPAPPLPVSLHPHLHAHIQKYTHTSSLSSLYLPAKSLSLIHYLQFVPLFHIDHIRHFQQHRWCIIE